MPRRPPCATCRTEATADAWAALQDLGSGNNPEAPLLRLREALVALQEAHGAIAIHLPAWAALELLGAAQATEAATLRLRLLLAQVPSATDG